MFIGKFRFSAKTVKKKYQNTSRMFMSWKCFIALIKKIREGVSEEAIKG